MTAEILLFPGVRLTNHPLVKTAQAEAREKQNQHHKHSMLFPEGASRKYYRLKLGRSKGIVGKERRYCYTSKRNAAGFYLCWVETVLCSGKIKRGPVSARRTRKRCIELCLARLRRDQATLSEKIRA
jgi:hypothetical protein